MAALGRGKHLTRTRNTCVRSLLYMSTPVVLPETIDLSDEQFGRQIPFETFAALRANAPIYWYAPGNCWVVTSYDLVERVNRDYRRFSNEGGIIGKDDPGHPRLQIMLNQDPPIHTMYRRLVNSKWTPRALLEHGDIVNRTVATVLAEFTAKGEGDFVTEVAGPIPARIIASIVGIPIEDAPLIWRWLNTLAPSTDPDYRPEPDSAARARQEMDAYLAGLIDARRKSPTDDLISALLALTKAESEPLDEQEVSDFISLFLTGGNETTRHLLSHTIEALLANPQEKRRFVTGEAPAALAAEEMLRWAAPVLHHSRWCLEETEVGGQPIRQGERVTLWMISANYDAAVFAEPHRLDLTRNPNPHVTFGGGGPHFCIGVHLARKEIITAYEALRPLLPSLQQTGPVDRLWSSLFNGIKHLPVKIT
jgi:cholest-4-en-3-one 26-monooxygenase